MESNMVRVQISLLFLIHLVSVAVCSDIVLKTNIDKIRGSRIVGGENTTIEAHPYQASLHFFHTHLCGASIISPRWLVTAAHCTTLDLGLRKNPIRGFTVRIGTNQLESGGEEICVLKSIDHPIYLLSDPVGFDYDISLLYLERDMTFSSTVQPIRLPETNEVYLSGTLATVIGWGRTDESSLSLAEILQEVQVPLVTLDDCKNYLGAYVTDRMICAGFVGGLKDACGGDSGGPLIVNNTLIGVVSWGSGCARENAPGVYTDVQVMRRWIMQQTGI